MEKDNFLHKHGLNTLPKKCVNYDKSNSQQNGVQGLKDPNSAKNAKK